MKIHLVRYCVIRVLVAISLLGGWGACQASIHTWTGPAGGLWSNAANWNGGLPTSNEALPTGTVVVFNTSTTSVCDITVTVDQIHFTGSGNTITGNGSVLSISGEVQSNNIQNDTGTNALASTLPVTLVGGVSIFVKVSAGTVTIGSNISGAAAAGLRVLGTGSAGVVLTGIHNTYLGTTSVASGLLQLNSNGVDTCVVGPIIVGAGGGPGATLQLLQGAEIDNTSAVTVNNDGVFDLNGKSQGIGSLSVQGGSVTVGSGSLTVIGTTQMAGGSISGTSPGLLALNGDVTATSSASAGAVISSAMSLNATTRTFTVNAGTIQPELTLSGLMSNGPSISGIKKAGTGTMLMSQSSANTNTYSGTTTVSAGVLQLNGGASSVLPAGPVVVGEGTGAAGSAVLRLLQGSEINNAASMTINSDGVFDFTSVASGLEVIANLVMNDGSVTLGSSALTLNGTLNMTGGTVTATTGKLALNGDVTATASATGSAAVTGGIQLNATIQMTVNPGAHQPELVVNGVVSEGVAGTGFKKAGTGTMNLTGPTSNTYTGVTTVDKGVLQLNQSTGRTIVGSGLVIGNNADPAGSAIVRELINNDINPTVAMTINSSGQFDMNGFQDTVSGLTGTGSVLLRNVGNNSAILTAGSGNGSFQFSGTFTGAGTLSKAGTGTMTLTNGFTAGTLLVSDGTVLLSGPTGSCAPGTLQVGDSVGATGSAVLRLGLGGQIAAGTPMAIFADGNLDLNGQSQSLGSLTLFQGEVSAGAGQLTINGTLTMNGGTVSSTAGGSVVLAGGIVATSSGIGSVISGTLTLATAAPVVTVNPGTSQPELNITAVIGETGGSRGLFKNGSGTMRLSPPQNTFTGALTIDKGVAQFNASSSTVVQSALVIGNDIDPPGTAKVQNVTIVNIAATCMVTIKASGILDLNGFSDRAGGLQGTGWATGGAATLSVLGAFDSQFNGNIVNLKINKNSTGTFTLGGAPTMIGTGTITVSAGIFNVAGLRTDANVTVSGGRLEGNGTAGTITGSGGVIDPGFPDIGTLSAAGNVVLNAGCPLSLRLDDNAGQRVDKLNALANLNVSAGVANISITGTPTRNAYVLAAYGTLTGTFPTITGVPAGYSLDYAYNDGTGHHTIALALPTVAVTGVATSIGNGTAKLNGTINPQGRTTSYYFDYGITTNYGFKTASKGGLTGSAAIPVVLPVSGLNGGSTWHFRLVGVNSSGTYYGDDATFITPGPLVTTGIASSVSALTATLTGAVNPQGLTATGWYEYGLTSAYGTKTPVLNFGNGAANVAISFPLSGLLPGKAYHYRLVGTTSAGTTAGADSSFATETVLAPVFLPGGQPVSLMKKTGVTATFTVAAQEGSPSPTDAPLTYQWNKNGVAIAGAKAATYTIASVALSHAGAYTCLIKNAGGSLLSAPAELGVVDGASKAQNVAQGATASVTVASAGNGLSFAWFKNGVGNGITSKVLTLPLVQDLDSAAYTCRVGGPGGTALSGAVNLAVYDGKPDILTPVTMPDGITGGVYSFQVPADPAPERAPTSYTVTGLPPGLTVNTSTGLISGRITFAAPAAGKSFPITLKAANAQGSTPVISSTLVVHAFPTAAIGTYNGLVDRDPLPLATATINAGLGGSVSATITGIGAYTGKLVLAGIAYPLTGAFNATVGSTELSTTATFARIGQSNLTVTFATDTSTGTLAGTVTDALAAISVDHSSSRNPWTAAAPTNKAGTYTTQLKIQNGGPIGNPAYPQGRGFATATVTAAGAVTWVGKMADGSSPTTSFTTTLSQGEVFPVHLMLNAGIGSAQGLVSLSADGTNINGGRPVMDGTLDWAKNSQPPGGPDRVYHDGITRFNLTVQGGKYASAAPVLGLIPSGTLGTNNAKITFNQGGLTGPEATLVNRPLRITPTNGVDLSNPAANPASLKLTLNATTGAISGSFILTDSGSPRTATFAGVIIPRTDVQAGAGYFLLPGPLPTAALSPILSGEVLLTPP